MFSIYPCERVPLPFVVAWDATSEMCIPSCLPNRKFMCGLKCFFFCVFKLFDLFVFLGLLFCMVFFRSLLKVSEYVHFPTYSYALGMVCKVLV